MIYIFLYVKLLKHGSISIVLRVNSDMLRCDMWVKNNYGHVEQ